MSGSIAAIAAYNGTGTQGYGTIDEQDRGVKSVFWNDYDTDKHFVNGCSVSEVTSNKGTITSEETIVFTFDNDIDAISDLQLVVEANTVEPHETNALPPWWMALLVERVEVCVGNQVISTINTAGLIKSFLDRENPSLYKSKIPYNLGLEAHPSVNDGDYSTIFKLPIFNTLNDNVDCSYLMGLANNQTLQVKVYPQNLSATDFSSNIGANRIDSPGADFTFKLFANNCTMTNAERNLLKNQVVPKRTNISQVATKFMPSGETFTPSSPITIVCDHFNIYADALYIVAGEMPFGNNTNAGANRAFNIEVFLNSSSYSGILPPEVTNVATSLNQYSHTDLDDVYYYKIPLSNLAMSKDQDFVPLGKYDSIRVVLTPISSITTTKSFVNTLSVIATGKTTGLYQNGAVTFSTF